MKGKIHVLVELNANYIKVYCLKIYFIPKICDVYDFVALLLLQTKCVSSFMIYVLSNFFFYKSLHKLPWKQFFHIF